MKSTTRQKLASWALQLLLLAAVLAPGIAAKFRPHLERPAWMFYVSVMTSCIVLYAIAGDTVKRFVKSETYKELAVYITATLMMGLMWVFVMAYTYCQLS